MPIKKETKKLIIFWIIATIFLVGWFFYWQIRNGNINLLRPLVNLAPVENQKKEELRGVLDIVNNFSQHDDQEKTFLILFQNDMELRPGGGYIGSFGILKIKNGEVESLEVHDTNIFDERIKDTVAPPYPMQKLLSIKKWGMRDSNWQPDFSDNAKAVEKFYQLGQGQEDFDGVVAVNTNILSSFLAITGPVTTPEFQEEFTSNNAIMKLEYEVEKGYEQRNLAVPERKQMLKSLAQSLFSRFKEIKLSKQLEIVNMLEKNLGEKNIQLYFKDSNLQKKVEDLSWAGKVRTDWNGDYLLINDANLASYKTDTVMDKSIDYQIDLSGDKPKAILKITYHNTAEKADWLIKDYKDYLRVYVPKGSWLTRSENIQELNFNEEYNKKVFGGFVYVPIGKTVTVTLEYTLPDDFRTKTYRLLIQKQSGYESRSVSAAVIDKEGSRHFQNVDLSKDYLWEPTL